jgi:hypothetical protein
VVGEDRPSPQRGASAQLAACIRQDKTRMACGQEMTYGCSILEDLRLAERVGMAFPEAVVEAEVDELEVLNTRQLRERGKALGVVPVGDGRTAEAWRLGSKAARGGVAQQAVAVAAVGAEEALALAEGAAAAGAEVVAELRRQGSSVSARGRVRKLAPSPKRRLADDSSGSGATGGGGRAGGRGGGRRRDCTGAEEDLGPQ